MGRSFRLFILRTSSDETDRWPAAKAAGRTRQGAGMARQKSDSAEEGVKNEITGEERPGGTPLRRVGEREPFCKSFIVSPPSFPS